MNTLKKSIISLNCFLVVQFVNFSAYAAATAGGTLPYEGWLTKIRNSVTGPLAFTLAIAGLVVGGGALIFGNAQMNDGVKYLLAFAVFVSFVVAAQNTLSSLTGVGAIIPL